MKILYKLKIATHFLIFFIKDFLIKQKAEIVPKSLLIVRLDAIGDYVLFRNYLEVIKESEKYKYYSITLLGNSIWKSLSVELDSEYIDSYIWLDRNRFNSDFIYRNIKIKEITSKGYEIALCPVYSRELNFCDNIIKLINAKEKVGSIGNLSNITKSQKDISDKYYTRLIQTQNEIMFEFNRNKEFFENFLDTSLHILKPYIKPIDKKLAFELPSKYAVLFIGASENYRKWGIESFANIGMWLNNKYKYKIVLCGGDSDQNITAKFAQYFNGEYINLVGQTSLIELLFIISNGDLMISNETSAPHFAVALEIRNVFVIYNGSHYGRFTPYTKDVAPNYHVVYHPEIEKDLNNYKKLSNSYGYKSDLDINKISVEMVQSKVEEVLSRKL